MNRCNQCDKAFDPTVLAPACPRCAHAVSTAMVVHTTNHAHNTQCTTELVVVVGRSVERRTVTTNPGGVVLSDVVERWVELVAPATVGTIVGPVVDGAGNSTAVTTTVTVDTWNIHRPVRVTGELVVTPTASRGAVPAPSTSGPSVGGVDLEDLTE